MRLQWNLMWLGLLAAVVLNCTGCGGISASPSVSPATFLLPGLLKNETANCTNSVAFLKVDAAGKSGAIEITLDR